MLNLIIWRGILCIISTTLSELSTDFSERFGTRRLTDLILESAYYRRCGRFRGYFCGKQLQNILVIVSLHVVLVRMMIYVAYGQLSYFGRFQKFRKNSASQIRQKIKLWYPLQKYFLRHQRKRKITVILSIKKRN